MEIVKNIFGALGLMVIGAVVFAAILGVCYIMFGGLIYLITITPEIIVDIICIIVIIVSFVFMFLCAYIKVEDWREKKH